MPCAPTASSSPYSSQPSSPSEINSPLEAKSLLPECTAPESQGQCAPVHADAHERLKRTRVFPLRGGQCGAEAAQASGDQLSAGASGPVLEPLPRPACAPASSESAGAAPPGPWGGPVGTPPRPAPRPSIGGRANGRREVAGAEIASGGHRAHAAPPPALRLQHAARRRRPWASPGPPPPVGRRHPRRAGPQPAARGLL